MSQHGTIGFLTPLLDGYYFGNVLAGVHQVTRRHGVQLIAIQGSARDERLPLLSSELIDGWIVLLTPEGLPSIVRSKQPLVMISALVPGLACPSVLPDNRGGVQAAVQHLIDHGHQRIAFVGCLGQEDIQQRYVGYQDALAAHGIAFDPSLVVDAANNMVHAGQAAARQLFAAGLPCTALVAATDLNAIGVMDVVLAAGYRIPEDLAVIGFDDMDVAQTTTPPLTTVRQRFDALGSTATELLLAQIAGEQVPQGITYVSTALITRRSCGCSIAQPAAPAAPPLSKEDAAHDWQGELMRRLVQHAYLPLTLDPATPPTHIWPGVAELVQALDAAIHGRPAPAEDALERSWQEAVALTSDIKTLYALLDLLQQAAATLLAARPADPDAPARLEVFMERARLELMRARLGREVVRIEHLEEQVRMNYEISLLLGQQTGEARQLTWLHHTPVIWGCLGLWSDGHQGETNELVVVGAYSRDTESVMPIGKRYTAPAFPPPEYVPTSTRGGGQDVVSLIPIQRAARDWGVLAVCGAFVHQLSFDLENMRMWGTQLGAALERESLLLSLAEQRETLRVAYERERALTDEVRELGCPIIPLLPEVLLVPLIGAIDSSRAQQIVEAVLRGVSTYQATVVLLDITGVPLVDTPVANSLIQAAKAATLLGARVVLVGVRPEIAQSIVGLGIDLSMLTTQPTLAAALQSLLGKRSPIRETGEWEKVSG